MTWQEIEVEGDEESRMISDGKCMNDGLTSTAGYARIAFYNYQNINRLTFGEVVTILPEDV
jgi:hypothetical protein